MNNKKSYLFEESHYTIPALQKILNQYATESHSHNFSQFCIDFAKDDELLALATHAKKTMHMPLFLVAVTRYLLINQPAPDELLACFYADYGGQNYNKAGYQRFRAFCLENSSKIADLLQEKTIPTNNLVRCAVLMPALCMVARIFPKTSCALIDLGTSAGLHLLLDLYSYVYPELGGQVFSGQFSEEFELKVKFAWRGRLIVDPKSFFIPPIITKRIGIDLAPIDLRNIEQQQWLAFFSPISQDTITGVLFLQEKVDFLLKEGDVLDCVETLCNQIPTHTLPIFMHSFMTVQFSPEKKMLLDKQLDLIGAKRDLAVIQLENDLANTSPVELVLRTYQRGVRTDQILARCEFPLDVGSYLVWQGPVD